MRSDRVGAGLNPVCRKSATVPGGARLRRALFPLSVGRDSRRALFKPRDRRQSETIKGKPWAVDRVGLALRHFRLVARIKGKSGFDRVSPHRAKPTSGGARLPSSPVQTSRRPTTRDDQRETLGGRSTRVCLPSFLVGRVPQGEVRVRRSLTPPNKTHRGHQRTS